MVFLRAMLKIVLYVVLGLFIMAAAIFAWAYHRVVYLPDIEPPAGATAAARVATIDAYLQELHADGRFNGAVLYLDGGAVHLDKTYGQRNAAGDTLRPGDMFRLASVSKQFTAATVLRAAALGHLELDQPVGELLELDYPGVTVRHLLNQTSGIPDAYFELADTHRAAVGEVLTVGKVVELMNRYGAAATAPPGTTYAYSNTDYVLLAAAVEAATDTTLEAFAARELFAPLGMSRTRYFNLRSADADDDRLTESFNGILPEKPALPMTYLDGVAGDGGVFAAAGDFVKWHEFWKGGHGLVPDDLLRQAFDPPVLGDGKRSHYGFGWVVRDDESHWHNGAWLGARTYVYRDPARDRLLVLLDNSNNTRIDDIAEQISGVLP